MSQALKVGIFMTIALVAVAYFILRIEDLTLFRPEGRRVDAVFDSVAGLDDKAPVRVAGVRVTEFSRVLRPVTQSRCILS